MVLRYAACLEGARRVNLYPVKDHEYERIKHAVNHGIAPLYGIK